MESAFTSTFFVWLLIVQQRWFQVDLFFPLTSRRGWRRPSFFFVQQRTSWRKIVYFSQGEELVGLQG